MQPIDHEQLARVTGGAGGALLGGLIQNAGPILNGVANIIGAAKSGGGGGGGGAAGAPPPGAAAAPAPAMGGGDPLVSVAVSINGVRQA